MPLPNIPTGGPDSFFDHKVIKPYNTVFSAVPSNRKVLFMQGGWPCGARDTADICSIALSTHLACMDTATPAAGETCVSILMRTLYPDKLGPAMNSVDYRIFFCASTLCRFWTKCFKVLRGTYFSMNETDLIFTGLLHTGYTPGTDQIPSYFEIEASSHRAARNLVSCPHVVHAAKMGVWKSEASLFASHKLFFIANPNGMGLTNIVVALV